LTKGSHDIAIRRLRASDAEGLVSCFRRCYEGTYHADAFHDPAQVARLVDKGRLRSVVAVAAGDGIVGHMGLRLRVPDASTAEAGNTVVDPRYRGEHLALQLGWALLELAVEIGLIGTHGYPTTAHPVIQKLEVQGGGFEFGVLLDYIPAETRYVGINPSAVQGRLAAVVIFRPLEAAPPRRVWVPARHRELVRSLYARATLQRDLAETHTALPASNTRLTARFEDRRGALRIEVQALGADLRGRIDRETQRQPSQLVLVDLPLAEPAASAATEALAQSGFFFGAVLPEYTDTGDVLRLQRPASERSAPQLATPEARELLAYITADRE
jgi:hypothetical protein